MDENPLVRFSTGSKFDFQLKEGVKLERDLADALTLMKIENPDALKVEVKSESHIWPKTGNIDIEYRRDGQLTGIGITEADLWMHVLMNEDRTEVLCVLMFAVAKLKEWAREAIRRGDVHHNGGDGDRTDNVLLPLAKVFSKWGYSGKPVDG